MSDRVTAAREAVGDAAYWYSDAIAHGGTGALESVELDKAFAAYDRAHTQELAARLKAENERREKTYRADIEYRTSNPPISVAYPHWLEAADFLLGDTQNLHSED